MRFLLSIVLLILGAVMVTPLISSARMLASSGTPDATALSIDLVSLIQGGIGMLLLILGLVLFIIRISRTTPARSA